MKAEGLVYDSSGGKLQPPGVPTGHAANRLFPPWSILTWLHANRAPNTKKFLMIVLAAEGQSWSKVFFADSLPDIQRSAKITVFSSFFTSPPHNFLIVILCDRLIQTGVLLCKMHKLSWCMIFFQNQNDKEWNAHHSKLMLCISGVSHWPVLQRDLLLVGLLNRCHSAPKVTHLLQALLMIKHMIPPHWAALW